MLESLVTETRYLRTCFVFALIISVLIGSCAKHEKVETTVNASRQDEEAIRKLSFEWITAANEKNTVWFDSVLADEYQMIHSKGTIHTKEQEIQEVKSDTSLTVYDRLNNLTVHMYGATAVVTSIEHLKGVTGNVPFDLKYFYTDVYIKRDGRWRVVITQATRLPDTEDSSI
ncbi:MAG: nuclear transport factor 2 family protein [Ignavibacteria bacterium]|nr:nuclear transport factor 2 family protein [Ignavibacteria bacterium]